VITASIDGTAVATVRNAAFPDGPAGIGSLGYYPVKYANFTVRPAAPGKS
jgi:hypothetical protein